MAENFPQQPISHEIDRKAVRSFESKIPSSWNSNPSVSDYGWDRLVTIPSSPGRVGDDFLVQIKGSESVNYLKESAEISHSIEVTTLNWLRSKPVPVMFAVCDVSKDEQPVFWTWISDAIETLENDNRDWTSQATVKIRIPVANRLSPETHSRIEQHVNDWHQTQRFSKQIAQALRSNRATPTSIAATKSENIFDIKQDVLSSLQKAGLADVSETDDGVHAEFLEPAAAELQRKITEAGTYLDALHDNAARRILRDVESKIDPLPIGIRAKYANCAGILALHDGQDALAREKFREALNLRSQETKYAVNALTVEFKISHDADKVLPTDWDHRLSAVLGSNPKSAGAIRLKTARLAELSGLDAAENYIRSSDLWEKQRRDALIALADVARDRGAVDYALHLIGEAEANDTGESDITLLAIKANLLLRKAVPDTSGGEKSTILGFGPPDLDISKLQLARQAYEVVLTRFAQCGYPRVAEQSFLNAVTVSSLIGDNDGGAEIARRFLEFYPDSGLVNGALALALHHKGDNVRAVPHAEIAFNEDPNFSQNYVRFANILMAADDHDGFLKLANQRQNKGFSNEREENITRALSAAAYAEKGESELADSQVEILLSRPGSYADGVIAQASVAQVRGINRREIASRIREHSRLAPLDSAILTVLALFLSPPTEDAADEIIVILKTLAESRQLAPEEIWALGRAYLLKEMLVESEATFKSGHFRYPKDVRFLLEIAHVLSRNGDDEGAYEIMMEYVTLTGRDHSQYWNVGMLAHSTGRLDEAITMLQKASRLEKDSAALKTIHTMLFDAKRRRGDPAKELYRHVSAFGQLVKDDPDEEARYLMMRLLTPLRDEDLADPEVAKWEQEFSARMDRFVTEHPKSKVLRRFKTPEGLSEQEQGLHFLSEIIAQQLPERLAAAQLELSARGTPWPLTFRKRTSPWMRSIFSYSAYCKTSRDFSHAFHIWYEHSDFIEEVQSVPVGQPVCIDITALLTLLDLDLLQEVFRLFPQLVIARGTIQTIREELHDITPPDPRASELDRFIKDHRQQIRTRPAYRALTMRGKDTSRYEWTGTLWQQQAASIADVFEDGVGESILVASQTDTALYCDDVYTRVCAKNDYKVRTFSSLALLTNARSNGRITLSDETRLLAKLKQLNYRHVRFTADHLHDRLKLILLACSGSGTSPTDLNADPILGVFLREFGDQEISDVSLVRVACDWWRMLLDDAQISEAVVRDIVETITFKLSQRTLENVLGKISVDTPNARIATIWAAFLVRLYLDSRSSQIPVAWRIIKSCATSMFPNQEKRIFQILYEMIPDTVHYAIQSNSTLSQTQKTTAIVSISLEFDEEDRRRFEDRLVKRVKM